MQESGLRSPGKLKQGGAGGAPSLGRGVEEAQQPYDVTYLSFQPRLFLTTPLVLQAG